MNYRQVIDCCEKNFNTLYIHIWFCIRLITILPSSWVYGEGIDTYKGVDYIVWSFQFTVSLHVRCSSILLLLMMLHGKEQCCCQMSCDALLPSYVSIYRRCKELLRVKESRDAQTKVHQLCLYVTFRRVNFAKVGNHSSRMRIYCHMVVISRFRLTLDKKLQFLNLAIKLIKFTLSTQLNLRDHIWLFCIFEGITSLIGERSIKLKNDKKKIFFRVLWKSSLYFRLL